MHRGPFVPGRRAFNILTAWQIKDALVASSVGLREVSRASGLATFKGDTKRRSFKKNHSSGAV